MAFHEVLFDDTIAAKFDGGPGFRTMIHEKPSGHETRVQRWSSPRYVFKSTKELSLDELYTLREFYIAREGATHGFRFPDLVDFSSGTLGRGTPQATDVVLGTGNGTQQVFQLRKTYTSGGFGKNRNITKPVDGSVKVALDSTELPATVSSVAYAFTVNTTTGRVTITPAPATSLVVTAGFLFDVPMRFGEGADELLNASHATFDRGSLQVEVVELLEEEETFDQWWSRGSTTFDPMAADITISMQNGFVIAVNPSSAGLKIILPELAMVGEGGPMFQLINLSGTHDVDIENETPATVDTLPSGGTRELVTARSTANAVEWKSLT